MSNIPEIEIDDNAVSPTILEDTAANTTPAPTKTSEFARPTQDTTVNHADTKRSLFDLPEYADRYTPIFSTIDEVVYRDPYRFSTKPAFWEQWTTEEYRVFANYLELVDLRPLARTLDKPVEEIWHMYHGVITGPLKDARKAKDRGVQTMKSWFKLYRESGTPVRNWTDKEIRGELEDITCKTVHLILEETGVKREVGLGDLTKDDLAWIHESTDITYRQILSGMADGEQVKYGTEDGLPPYTKSLKRKLSPQPTTPQQSKQARLTAPMTAPAKLVTTPSALSNPSPSKAPTILPVRMTSATPSGSFIYRHWTSAEVVARLRTTSPGAVVLTERTSGEPITISLPALSPEDKSWLNSMRKDKRIEDSLWQALKTTNASSANAFRPWTHEGILARVEQLSHQAVRLLLLSDRSALKVASADLTETDKAYLREHFEEGRVELLFGQATPAPSHTPAPLPRHDEPYEAMSVAPVRRWTECNLMAHLVGISKHTVYLRVEGQDGIRELPIGQCSVDDKDWLEAYLTTQQLVILRAS